MILLMKYPKMGLIMSVDSSLARIGFGDIYADLDQLRDSASFGVANQNHKNCEKIADDICSLAVSYRLKIFDTIRSNKNINHPAKDVINALGALASKIDKFKERNEWRHDCFENPHSPLDKFVFFYCGDGSILNSTELSNIRKNLELAFLKENEYDDELFKKFARTTFVNLLRDLLRLTHKNKLKIQFSNDFDAIDKSSLFFVFLRVFKFCEYELDGGEFIWLPWVREKSSCKSLERLLLNRLDALRNNQKKPGKPIATPFCLDVNSVEPEAYEIIDIEGTRVDGDLFFADGYGGYEFPVIKGKLPNFSK